MKIKRIVAILLTLCLLLPCSAVFAQSPVLNDYEDNGVFTYLAFGDSFTRGVNSSPNWREEHDIEYCRSEHQMRNITGTYSYLVAQALGCDCTTDKGYLEERGATYWPVCLNAMLLSTVLDLFGLDDGYYDSAYYHSGKNIHKNRYQRTLEYFGNPDSSCATTDEKYGKYGTTYDVRDIASKADLITLELGQADIFYRPYQCILTSDLDLSVSNAADILEILVKEMDLGFKVAQKSYPILLEYLKEINPNGTIIIIGTANPAFNLGLTDDFNYPLGSAFSLAAMKYNAFLKKLADKYDVEYVDISNVDTGTTENDWSLLDGWFGYGDADEGTHPSPDGYAYMAREVLRTYYNVQEERRLDLSLDIGRIKGVSSLYINGLPYRDFDLNGKILTVHFKTPLATKLVINYVGTDGKVQSSTYQLAYRNGYTAYRVSTTNNKVSALTSVTNKTSALIKTVSGLLK